MKTKELIYMVMDLMKNVSDDAYFTEEHVQWLLNKTRAFLLKREYDQLKRQNSESNKQSICLDMEFTSCMCGSVCDDTMLKSVQEVPKTVGTANPQVTTLDYFGGKMTYVTPEKMRYVNYNKFLKNIIFCTMGPDGHVYLKSSNPQFANIEKIKFTGVFEDFEAAAELSCDENGNKDNCDPFEKEFPIDAYLVPELIDRVLKELLGASYRPKDQQNDASDSLSQIANFIRDYVKKPLQRQIDGTEND